MVTDRSGSASSFTLTVTVLPSSTMYVARSKLTSTDGTSSSVMLTIASLVEPLVTPVGRLDPKVSFTLSPSSFSSSEAAEKVKLSSVSPATKVTLAGTPE